MYNMQNNRTTLGNQLDGIRLVEPDVIERFRSEYPGDPQETIAKICFRDKPPEDTKPA